MDISSISGGFNSFIEGAAALIVIYWLLASLSSFVVEIFSSMFNIRGNALRLFIVDMVQGELNKAVPAGGIPIAPKGIFANRMPNAGWFGWLSGKIDLTHGSLHGFSKNLFSHPLMLALEQPKVDRGSSNTAPAYVPSTVFAKTTIDLLRDVPDITGLVGAAEIDKMFASAQRANPALATALSRIAAPLIAELQALKPTAAMNGYDLVVAALGAVFSTSTGTTITDAFNAAASAAVPPLASPFSATASSDEKARLVADTWLGGPAGPLGKIVAPLPATIAGVVTALERKDVPEALRRALRPLVDAANHDMDRLSNEIALWYDASMQRATGWYKRYTMLFLGIIGFLFAAAFNVDTPRIIAALIKSPALRQSGYAAAAQVVNTKDETSRAALPQQLSYARTFDSLCRALAEKQGSNSPIMTCSATAESSASETDYWKLLPLTLQSGASGQVVAIIKMFTLAGAKPSFTSKQTFARQLQSFCETNSDCSSALKDAIIAYAELPADDDAKFAAMKSAFVNNSKLFWYPGVAGRLIDGAAPKPPLWPAKTLQDGKTSADAAAGAIAAYSQGIPGVGPVLAVYKSENWTFGDTVTAVLGWVLTALMVSLGAPFWFDLLQQLVNRRGAGPKPAAAIPAPIT